MMHSYRLASSYSLGHFHLRLNFTTKCQWLMVIKVENINVFFLVATAAVQINGDREDEHREKNRSLYLSKCTL